MSGTESALIVGAGKGLGASLARLCAAEGMRVALAARHIKLSDSMRQEPWRCAAMPRF
jgi:NAD(P)-dependent dehydrogenase (short-subunit alcohol dehydrogenase family)